MLGIGERDRSIMIQKAILLKDTMGGDIWTWEETSTEWAFVEWKEGLTLLMSDTTESRLTLEFTIQNVSEAQQDISANQYRVAFPLSSGVVIPTETQYYTVTGIRIHGGREVYKTLITHLATDDKPTA